ncbi:MAG: hypothetical protein OEZ32_08595 [Nitrospinota bacterium]|nr:hypothetical protein [Nitrospinota bacterium]
MARYDRISKRNTDKNRLLSDPSAQSWEWLDKHGWKVGAGAAVLFVAGLILLGVGYYQKVTLADAQTKLFHAAALESKASAGQASPREAIEEYENLIASSSRTDVQVQARMLLAGLYMREGEPGRAVEHFTLAAAFAGEGSMFGEFCQVGMALALADQGKADEAETKLKALSASAKFYPKEEILRELAFIQAAAGRNKEAGQTLTAASGQADPAIPSPPLDDTIGRMKRGEISKGLEQLYAVMQKAAEEAEQKALEQSLSAPKVPGQPALVTPDAVHGGGKSGSK